MRIGAVTTAGQMFARLGRVREQMSCLVVEGKVHAAGQLCEDMLVSAQGAKRHELLCLLGGKKHCGVVLLPLFVVLC